MPERADLWPDAETLAAGDEELVTEPDYAVHPGSIKFSDIHFVGRHRRDPRSTSNEDGHLEDDDYWRRHPETQG